MTYYKYPVIYPERHRRCNVITLRQITLIFIILAVALLFSDETWAFSWGGPACDNLCTTKLHYCSFREESAQLYAERTCSNQCQEQDYACRENCTGSLTTCRDKCETSRRSGDNQTIPEVECLNMCVDNADVCITECGAQNASCWSRCGSSGSTS